MKKVMSMPGGLKRIAEAMVMVDKEAYQKKLDERPRDELYYWFNPYIGFCGRRDYQRFFRWAFKYKNKPKLNKIQDELRKAWREGRDKDVLKLEKKYDKELMKGSKKVDMPIYDKEEK